MIFVFMNFKFVLIYICLYLVNIICYYHSLYIIWFVVICYAVLFSYWFFKKNINYVLLHYVHSNTNIFLSYNKEKQQTHEKRFLWIDFNTSNQFRYRKYTKKVILCSCFNKLQNMKKKRMQLLSNLIYH